jgi:hypothetical protein
MPSALLSKQHKAYAKSEARFQIAVFTFEQSPSTSIVYKYRLQVLEFETQVTMVYMYCIWYKVLGLYCPASGKGVFLLPQV